MLYLVWHNLQFLVGKDHIGNAPFSHNTFKMYIHLIGDINAHITKYILKDHITICCMKGSIFSHKIPSNVRDSWQSLITLTEPTNKVRRILKLVVLLWKDKMQPETSLLTMKMFLINNTITCFTWNKCLSVQFNWNNRRVECWLRVSFCVVATIGIFDQCTAWLIFYFNVCV